MRCQASGCDAEATGAFLWPGGSLTAQCERHVAWAHRVADTMGFRLALYPVSFVEAPLAGDSLRRLSPEVHVDG